MIWLLGGLVILAWYLIIKYSFKKHVTGPVSGDICPSPDCLRCSSRLKNTYRNQVAQQFLVLHSSYEADVLEKLLERLTFSTEELPPQQRPTVCFLRGVSPEPWHTHKLGYIQDILSDSSSAIKAEVISALDKPALWSHSEDSSWRKLFLYNQGHKMSENCSELPRTTNLVEQFDVFMGSVIFGNCFISIIEGSSVIEPHCGPTNLRVRCHLGLQIPAGDCQLTVAGEESKWRDRECILFDDSFLHSVHNNTPAQRIILIVDIWHPNLTLIEIDILKKMFSTKTH